MVIFPLSLFLVWVLLAGTSARPRLGPASSASRQPPPSAEHVKSGGPVAKRKRLEDQHESAPDAPLSKRLAVGESVGVGSANSSGRRTAPAPNGATSFPPPLDRRCATGAPRSRGSRERL